MRRFGVTVNLYTATKSNIVGEYADLIVNVEAKFLFMNYDFNVVFSKTKYTRENAEKMVNELISFEKQINYVSIYVCECDDLPQGDTMWALDKFVSFLLINEKSHVFEKDFWVSMGDGKAKKCADDIVTVYRNSHRKTAEN